MSGLEVSIIIVNHNGYEYVKKCIQSILSSKTSNYEIIIVDNGSDDSSVPKLKKDFEQYSNLTYIELTENFGPAKARNIGVNASHGDYIGFLDNDTTVDPLWATAAVSYLKNNKEIGVLQCKLLLAKDKNKIDYVGEYLGQNGFLVQRAVTGDVDSGQYDEKVSILAAKSAGMFITKKAFTEAGGFDEDYFIYVEETDLGWRTWLEGYKVIFFPESIVYHEFGTSSVILSKNQNNYNTKFHGCKNYILTLSKNLGLLRLFTILPLHIALWIGLAWFSLFRHQTQSFIYIHKALFWHLQNIGKTLKKRNIVQSSRKVPDSVLFEKLMQSKPFSYYLDKAATIRKVGNAQGFIKKD